jgi:hypothetical protein
MEGNMAIGLTLEQLNATFEDLLVKEQDKFKGLFEAEAHGEYPAGTEILKEVGVNPEGFGNVILAQCIAHALLGAILANNEAIAKNLPSSKQ